MDAPPGEITALLAEWKHRNRDALAKLMPLVYKELRRLAGPYMHAELSGRGLS